MAGYLYHKVESIHVFIGPRGTPPAAINVSVLRTPRDGPQPQAPAPNRKRPPHRQHPEAAEARRTRPRRNRPLTRVPGATDNNLPGPQAQARLPQRSRSWKGRQEAEALEEALCSRRCGARAEEEEEAQEGACVGNQGACPRPASGPPPSVRPSLCSTLPQPPSLGGSQAPIWSPSLGTWSPCSTRGALPKRAMARGEYSGYNQPRTLHSLLQGLASTHPHWPPGAASGRAARPPLPRSRAALPHLGEER